MHEPQEHDSFYGRTQFMCPFVSKLQQKLSFNMTTLRQNKTHCNLQKNMFVSSKHHKICGYEAGTTTKAGCHIR